MKRALKGRALRATITLVAMGGAALTTAGIAAAHAATGHPSSQLPNACSAKFHGKARAGHFAGIVRAQSIKANCDVHATGDPANGTPPLIFHNGPVMGTPTTGPIVVRPIFWNPAGHPMDTAYKNIITTYLADVAAASGQHTNVYSTLNEYFGSNGAISYKFRLARPINDTSSLPADGCKVNGHDSRRIYADNTGYNACLDDAQVTGEIDRIIDARGLTRDFAHIYVMFLPKHVESCFFAGSTTTASNACTINYQPSAAYCAYHTQVTGTGTVYANMPFPIYTSPVGFTCSSDARSAGLGGVQTPNGNADADTEVSPTSHEIMEAATDPDTATGWFDSSGFENGDECAYVFGVTQGTSGAFYNQVINGHHYLTQEEFSNNAFANGGGGCLQSE